MCLVQMTGGGTPGECDQASGVLAQFEVLSLIADGNNPIYDSESETYWFDDSVRIVVAFIYKILTLHMTPYLSQNGDLITFDQADTWR